MRRVAARVSTERSGRRGQQILDAEYNVSILRTQAYLFVHPEIECDIKWQNMTSMNNGNRQWFSVSVDCHGFWHVHSEVSRKFGTPKVQ